MVERKPLFSLLADIHCMLNIVILRLFVPAICCLFPGK